MGETIGERLKRIRREHGLTQIDVYKTVHITNQTLSKYENGVITNIPTDKIEALSKLYGVSPSVIMGWEDFSEPNKRKSKINLGDKIRIRRQELNMSQEELANKLGYKSRSTIAKIESGENDLNQTKIKAFAKVLHTTPTYFFDCDEEQSTFKTKPASFSTYTEVPIGISTSALDNENAYSHFPRISIPDSMLGKYAGKDNLVFVHVNGDSMNKVIANGSLVGVLTNTTYENGDIVVFSDDEEYAIKRYFDYPDQRRIMFFSDSINGLFPPTVLSYEEADKIKILGKVVIYQVIL